MIVKTVEQITILKVVPKTFKGRDGKDVTYNAYSGIDEAGNVFQGTVHKDAGGDVYELDMVKCHAVFEVTEREKKLRMQLVSVE